MSKTIAAAIAVTMAASSHAALADDFDFKGSFAKSAGFTKYVPAVSNPLFNETPYITTELRALYLRHNLPQRVETGLGVLPLGGTIDLWAAEFRIALTDRLGFIATKDGFVDIDFNNTLKDTNGFANLAAGLKYALIVDPATNGIVTVGLKYEAPSGSIQTGVPNSTIAVRLQGDGDGFMNPFITAARRFGDLGVQASVGVNQALDTAYNSSMIHFAGHVDYEILPGLFPSFEMNGWSVYDSGNRLPFNFEGVDVVNFGSTGSGTVVTAAFGGRYQFNDNIQVGFAYERPITNREDIFDDRYFVDLVLRY